MKQLFEPFGTVNVVSIPRHRETLLPRGFAFVDMSSKEEMMAAIAGVDGEEIDGRRIRATESVPKEEQPSSVDRSTAPEGYKNLYVGNLPLDASQQDVKDAFKGYEVTEVVIPKSSDSGMGRGYAFVTMAEGDATQALEQDGKLEFQGQALSVRLPWPPGQRGGGDTNRMKVYIGNLSFYTVRDTLYAMFEEFGTVHDVYLPLDQATGSTRGFGFVTMDRDAAENAIGELNGCEVDGRVIRVNEARSKFRSDGAATTPAFFEGTNVIDSKF